MERHYQVAELVDTFENQSLVWLRAADNFDLSDSKISRLVRQALAIEELLSDVKDYQSRPGYVDQVFLALLDNPRLANIDRYIPLIYKKRERAARRTYHKRQKLWMTVNKLPIVVKELSIKNVVRSLEGSFEGCNSIQGLKCAVLRTDLSALKSDREKLQVIRSMMDDKHFQEKKSLKTLLDIVRDHDPDLLTRL